MNAFLRRSVYVIAAVCCYFSMGVSPARAVGNPNEFPAFTRTLPPTADFSLTALFPGTSVTGYLGPASFNPLNGYPPSGYDPTGFTRLDLPYAGIIEATRRDGALLRTYCLDLQDEAWGKMAYRFTTWSEEHVPNLGYIERILHDYYPATPQPLGITEEQKAAAVQAAIWFFSDKYVLASDDPLFSVTSTIVTQVLREGPLPEPEHPSVLITGPDRIHAGAVSGPFTVHTTAARATVTITGGEMFADAAGTRPIPSGSELRDGDTFYVRSAEPGKVKLSATASAISLAGEVALYVRDVVQQPTFPERGQKILLAADVRVDISTEKEVEVLKALPKPPVKPQRPRVHPIVPVTG